MNSMVTGPNINRCDALSPPPYYGRHSINRVHITLHFAC